LLFGYILKLIRLNKISRKEAGRMKNETFKIPKQIKAAEARMRFGEVIDTARYAHTHYLVTKAGKPMVIILGVEDYENMIDMVDTIAEQLDPRFQEELKQSRKEYEKGEVGTIEDIRRILRRKERPLA
jgi:prevent-host-death family protein